MMMLILLFILIVLFIFIIYRIVLNSYENYVDNDPLLQQLFQRIKPIFDQKHTGVLSMLNNKNILNHITLSKASKSFTLNKKNIHLCTQNENNDAYDLNILTFVLLHEIAHVICTEIGHSKKFFDIFSELLNEAEKLNIYDPSIEINYDYCLKNTK